MSKHYTVETERNVYLQPFEQGGKWRVRRRAKGSHEIDEKGKCRYKSTTLTLEAENGKEARQEVIELSEKDKREEELLAKVESVEKIVNVTLENALDEWSATQDFTSVRAKTRAEYSSLVNVYKTRLGSHNTVRQIGLTAIENFYKAIADRSARTKLKHLAMLRRFFEWCAAHDYIGYNPVSKFRVPVSWRKEVKRINQTKGQSLSLDEARKLIQFCKDTFDVKRKRKAGDKKGKAFKTSQWTPPEHLYLFVLIALRTGLRAGNIVGLSWVDINLEDETISIPHDRMKNDLDFHVPMHKELVAELKILLASFKKVPAPQEPMLSVEYLKRSFKNALKRAKLDDREFRIHDMRHTFASWLGEFCPHAICQKLLGHSATNVTDIYIKHQNIETLREWLNKLPWLSLQQVNSVDGRQVGE